MRYFKCHNCQEFATEKTLCLTNCPYGRHDWREVWVAETVPLKDERVKGMMEKFANSIDTIGRRKEQELHKLLTDPTLYDVATQLTDALMVDLTYLCNFQYLQSMAGKTDTVTVIKRLEKGVRETFKRLTGQEYQPEICRNLKFREGE